MAPTIGIDLGTTKSAIGYWHPDGEPRLIPYQFEEQSYLITPSVVAFDATSGRWEVGRRARRLAEQDPQCSINSIKRLIGRRIPGAELAQELHRLHLLYRVEASPHHSGGLDVLVGGDRLSPQDISARVLRKLKIDAETFLQEDPEHPVTVDKAVITVPAYFDTSRREATRDAGRIAGLEVERIISEPTAACLAFGYQRLAEERRTIAVYDLGGGTFDISILDIGRGPFDVLATNGNTVLGGDDIDRALVDWALGQLKPADQARLQGDMIARARLRTAAERCKIALSDAEAAELVVAGPLSPNAGIPDLCLPITRAELERLARPWIEKTLARCRLALHDARDAKGGALQISDVLMVGGQTRMPAVRDAVRDLFQVEPNVSVDPVQVVALGATVHAATLAKQTSGLDLYDVAPLTLGVEIENGVMEAVIPRNTKLPVDQTHDRTFTTTEDFQDFVPVEVYQGERPLVADNVKLGSLVLRDIQQAPRGVPQIELTFGMDTNAILTVTARDKITGSNKSISITDSVRMSEDEIRQAHKHAVEHMDEYEATRRLVELHGRLKKAQERLRSFWAEQREHLPASLHDQIEDALDGDLPPDVPASAAYLEALHQLWMKVQPPPPTD